MESTETKYIVGLDIGIGSVGWAVVNKDKLRIEDFGVRLFESGEIVDNGRRKRTSQQRRGFRAIRRLYRRRAHRKERLKKHFIYAGLVTAESLAAYYEKGSNMPMLLRVRGLNEKLAPEELAAAMIHIAGHRGYNDFYRIDDSEALAEMTAEEKEEYEKDKQSLEAYERLKAELGGDMTPAQLFMSHPKFMTIHGVNYRNSGTKDEAGRVLVPREALKNEAERLFEKQAQYYPAITADFIAKAMDIMFSQRDFEDGPGDPDDPNRKYKGFLDTIGKCTFYPEENRGARYTVPGDMYVLVNRLSQNRYVDLKTGELVDNGEAYKAILRYALENCDLDVAAIKTILKPFGIEMINTPGDAPNRCLAYLRMIRPVLESSGFDWNKLIAEDLWSFESGKTALLNRIGVILSENRTPERRIRKLCEVDGITKTAARKLAAVKTNGTLKVSYKYMRESVEAFEEGETYGNFQARFNKAEEKAATGKRTGKLPPIADEDYIRNPVVLRSINETRKVLNAIIEKYGSPYAINIEVASDLARSFEERARLQKENRDNEKKNEACAQKIAGLLNNNEEITSTQIERYKLGELQGWKCPYCGGDITQSVAIRNGDRNYEVDHIIPYSLILDNTLHNKVLVCSGCNQAKGQRTPLMYLGGTAREKDFIKWANGALRSKKISKRKHKYLLQRDIYSGEAQMLLSEWKSRNLNDTRYISKYLVRYLQERLLFNSDEKKNVYAVKGAITSRLRRVWLNKDTWGDDKSELRSASNLHHAVDAVVIANCMPGYVELAEHSMRLWRIYKEAGKQITQDYKLAFESAVENLQKYYGMPRYLTEPLLKNIKKVPALIPELREEVELRFNDCGLQQKAQYFSRLKHFYEDDAFVERCALPLVSYKPDRKFSGEATAAKALAKGKSKGTGYVKTIGEKNASVLNDDKYYCIELYRDTKEQLRMRGIKYTGLKRQNGKLYLTDAEPEGYAAHVMYLFKNDYIRIRDKNGMVKFEGYYVSVYDLKSQRVCTASRYEGKTARPTSILRCDSVAKYDVSILGRLGGEIPCGKPFLLQKEKD